MKPVAPVTKYAINAETTPIHLRRVSGPCGAAQAPAPAPPRPSPGGEALGAAGAVLKDLRTGGGLEGKTLRQRHPETLDCGAAIGEHRRLREAGEALRELECAIEMGARRDHLGQQPHRERLARVDHPPREDQIQCTPESDHARQALGAAVDQRHTPAPLGVAQDGRVCRDPQVAPQRDLEPAREAVAGDRGDRGLGRSEPREAHRALLAHQTALHRTGRLQVRSGAEGELTGTGHDEHASVLVRLEAQVCLVQRGRGRAVDGVAALGPVDRDQRRRADALVPDRRL